MSTAESDLLARYNRLIEENIHREYEQLCRNGSRQKRNPVQSKNRAQNSPNRANVVANCRPYDHSIRMISGNTQQTLTPIAANIRQNTILTLPSAVRNRLSTADGPGNTVNTSGHHE